MVILRMLKQASYFKTNYIVKIVVPKGMESEMITFKNELPMDHERSLEHLVELWTQDLINHYTDTPFSTNYDACYESAWAEIEEEFHWEKLEMVEI